MPRSLMEPRHRESRAGSQHARLAPRYRSAMTRVLSLIPPMTQLNTPYPATAYLTGFLRSRGIDAVQADPAIELVCRLFSRTGLQRVRAALDPRSRAASVRSFLAQADRYVATVDAAIRF